jgi:acyl CoA:acetate/3-ketoacid CoA transferase alpha subunit
MSLGDARMDGFYKRVENCVNALDGLVDGMTLIARGLRSCGIHENLIGKIRTIGRKDRTVISDNCGVDGWPWTTLRVAPDRKNDRLLRRRKPVV